MNWLDLEAPQAWCPECEAPWVEHEIIRLDPAEPTTQFVLGREGCPADREILLSYTRSRSERSLRNLADEQSARSMWKRYEAEYSRRTLLDRLADADLA
jgi:hypothetical protein